MGYTSQEEAQKRHLHFCLTLFDGDSFRLRFSTEGFEHRNASERELIEHHTTPLVEVVQSLLIH